jgi:hypothetical protein
MECDEYVVAAPKRIDDGITDDLRLEIQTLVDAKYLVDELAHKAAGERLASAFHDGAYGPRHGVELFRTVLPFSQLDFLGGEFSAFVPTAQTIGASWKWTTRSVPEDERQSLLAKLQDPEQARRGGSDRAEYTWIKPLGLFLAHEGKNRVGFFRDMKAEWIPAVVSPCDYPAPDRLVIYETRRADRAVFWAVLDDSLLEPIHYPEWTMPVLRAYGVQEFQSWPGRFPSLYATAHAIHTSTADSLTSRVPPLDLRQILAEEKFQAEEISCSLMEIETVKVSWRFRVSMALVCVASVLVVGALPSDLQTVRILFGMFAGTAFGAMVSAVLPILRAARRNIDRMAVYREFGPQTTQSVTARFRG